MCRRGLQVLQGEPTAVEMRGQCQSEAGVHQAQVHEQISFLDFVRGVDFPAGLSGNVPFRIEEKLSSIRVTTLITSFNIIRRKNLRLPQ